MHPKLLFSDMNRILLPQHLLPMCPFTMTLEMMVKKRHFGREKKILISTDFKEEQEPQIVVKFSSSALSIITFQPTL